MTLFRKSSRKWRGVDFMGLIPVQACEWEPAESDDRVIVLQKRYATGILGRFLQPRIKDGKKFIRIPLEEKGSYLWKLMDGDRTVGDMAIAFAADFPGDNEQIPERVATYLYQMVENKMIEFVNFKV